MEKTILMYIAMWIVFLSLIFIKLFVEIYFRKINKMEAAAEKEGDVNMALSFKKKWVNGVLVYRLILYTITVLLFIFAPDFIWDSWMYGFTIISVYTFGKLLLIFNSGNNSIIMNRLKLDHFDLAFFVKKNLHFDAVFNLFLPEQDFYRTADCGLKKLG